MQLLVGSDGHSSDGAIQQQADESGLDITTCIALTRAAGSLFWEFTKSGTSNPATISAILLQLGLEKDMADIFGVVRRLILYHVKENIVNYLLEL